MLLASLCTAVVCSSASAITAPPELSAARTRVAINSSYGSGAFGRWETDPFGLPAYDYTLDQLTAPQAPQPELKGSHDAWHQLGNDHVVADAFNSGYVQLWSQDRRYEWINAYDASTRHFSGGFGFLRLAGRTYSTQYRGGAGGERMRRIFGLGYFDRRTTVPGATVDEQIYAPAGNDPLLLHDVRVTNDSSHREALAILNEPCADKHPRYYTRAK